MRPRNRTGTIKSKMMNSTSNKIRVYTNGIADGDVGAYAYIVLESRNCGEVLGGTMFAPSLLRSKFAQAGKSSSKDRMKMRAVYEGVRHCPDGTEVEIYTDDFLVDSCLKVTKATEEDGDIAVRYRQYIADHRITPKFIITKVYKDADLPDNDHDEWTWWAHHLCCDAVKRFRKENKIAERKNESANSTIDGLFGGRVG